MAAGLVYLARVRAKAEVEALNNPAALNPTAPPEAANDLGVEGAEPAVDAVPLDRKSVV